MTAAEDRAEQIRAHADEVLSWYPHARRGPVTALAEGSLWLLRERTELLRRVEQAERAGAVKAWTRCVEWFAALRGAERVRNTVLLAAEDANPYENGADL